MYLIVYCFIKYFFVKSSSKVGLKILKRNVLCLAHLTIKRIVIILSELCLMSLINWFLKWTWTEKICREKEINRALPCGPPNWTFVFNISMFYVVLRVSVSTFSNLDVRSSADVGWLISVVSIYLKDDWWVLSLGFMQWRLLWKKFT